MCACVELCWNQNWERKKEKKRKKSPQNLKKIKCIKQVIARVSSAKCSFLQGRYISSQIAEKNKRKKSCKVIVYESWWIKKKSSIKFLFLLLFLLFFATLQTSQSQFRVRNYVKFWYLRVWESPQWSTPSSLSEVFQVLLGK